MIDAGRRAWPHKRRQPGRVACKKFLARGFSSDRDPGKKWSRWNKRRKAKQADYVQDSGLYFNFGYSAGAQACYVQAGNGVVWNAPQMENYTKGFIGGGASVPVPVPGLSVGVEGAQGSRDYMSWRADPSAAGQAGLTVSLSPLPWSAAAGPSEYMHVPLPAWVERIWWFLDDPMDFGKYYRRFFSREAKKKDC